MRSAQPQRRVRRPLGVGLAAILAHGIAGFSQTRIDLSKQARTVDFSEASSTRPSKTGTVLPAACSTGETYFRTDAPAGQNLHLCTSPNVWTAIAGSGGGGSGPSGFLSELGLISLTAPTDAVSLGAATGLGKLAVVGTSDQTQTLIRGFAGQTQDLLQAQRSDGSVLARIDKDGFLAQGVGITTGHASIFGNPGDTGASSLTMYSGDTAAKPPYLEMFDSASNRSTLFPCGSLAGRWCQDSVIPGAAYTNPLLSTTSSDTVSNKTIDNSNRQNGYLDWDEIALPVTNPSAGRLRIYARAGNICWLTSGGSETCTGAGGGVASVGLAMPAQFSVSNSPVTSTGTLTAAWQTQPANTLLAGPAGGGSGAPDFRALAGADLPRTVDTVGGGLHLLWGYSGATGNSTQAANEHRLFQFVLEHPITISQMVLRVAASGGSGTGARFVIWNSSCDTRVADTGTITGPDVETTGVKVLSLLGGPVTIHPGTYYLGYAFQSSIVALIVPTGLGTGMGPILNNGDNTRWGTGASPSGSGASFDLPATCGTIAAATNSPPVIGLQR